MFIRREHWSRKSRRTYAAVVSSEWKLLTSCSSGLQICLWKTISLPQTSLTPIVLSLLFPMRAIEPAQPCDLSPPRASKALLPRLLLRHVNDAQDRLHVYVNNNNVNSAPLLSFSSISGYETSATVTQRFTGGMSDEGVLCEELYFAAAQMHWSTNSVLVRLQCTYHLPILSMTNASFVICFLFLLGPHHEFLGSAKTPNNLLFSLRRESFTSEALKRKNAVKSWNMPHSGGARLLSRQQSEPSSIPSLFLYLSKSNLKKLKAVI